MKFIETEKDKKKVIRSVVEGLVLIGILALLLHALFVFKKYMPYDKEDPSIIGNDESGFLALSYFAVDRDGTSTMISTDRLNEHLKALHKNGYVTITQEDILNYYEKGIPLPQKALFLMFEDGRKDTAIFAQKILEKYNYKGTILSYADRFHTRDFKFLTPKDLKNLNGNTFWELGTNGYRLSYINVFDRKGNHLGEMDSSEYNSYREELYRNYNHYLMDFIRDENQIPRETYEELEERISKDYKLMDEIYTKDLGSLPDLYVLMHSNTGGFGNNRKASMVNEKWIKKLFKMNFNREGYSYNNRENSMIDLTRMQPQAYWYPNHLLMRIKDDIQGEIQFEEGDLARKEDWEVLEGVSEFRGPVIALTSEPEGNGLLRLKGSKYADFKLEVSLTGNKIGTQTIYLRADEDLKKYVSVKLQNNYLYIIENGKDLYTLDLATLDAPVKEKEQKSAAKKKEDIPPIQINEGGNRKIQIILKKDKIWVNVDGKKVAGEVPLSGGSTGYIYLESAWGEYGYSQRNIADDVYDGVFEDITIRDGDNDNIVLYDNQLHGSEKAKAEISGKFKRVVNWFIKAL